MLTVIASYSFMNCRLVGMPGIVIKSLELETRKLLVQQLRPIRELELFATYKEKQYKNLENFVQHC